MAHTTLGIRTILKKEWPNIRQLKPEVTSRRLPVKLVFSEDFPTREEALASEQRIKGWSRKKKKALIERDWAEVSRLAQRRHPSKPQGAENIFIVAIVNTS